MSGVFRLDMLLVQRGLLESRAAARAAIEAGKVTVNGAVIKKCAARYPFDAQIAAEPAHPYVSRGGLKLAHALEHFGVSARARHCLDLGASTGGFTQVLLMNGAQRVTSVDVGTAQFHPSLREDGRVALMEQCDVRDLKACMFDRSFDLLACDLSFIGLEKAIGPALKLAAGDADLVGLFKPQFQVGRSAVGKGGIVKDKDAVTQAVDQFTVWMGHQHWRILDWVDSPIPGGDGNTEKLFHTKPT